MNLLGLHIFHGLVLFLSIQDYVVMNLLGLHANNVTNLIFFSFHAVIVKVYPIQATLSPEVTSKPAPNEEVSTPKKYNEEGIDVKTLTNELAAALLEISAKEDMVKQHSKVAEEAISGIYCLEQIFNS